MQEAEKMPERRSDCQDTSQNEETIKMMEIQKRSINLSEMPYVVLREIFKNVHLQSAQKMMRANKSLNAFVTRNRRLWRKSSIDIEVAFKRSSDGRVKFKIVLTSAGANLQCEVKLEEAESGSLITPDEDIFIQKELKANVADPMRQFLKIMKTVVEEFNITRLDLRNMPDEATIALAAIFDKKTIIEEVFKRDDSRCPTTLQKFVRSLRGTERIKFEVSREAITADLFKLPQIQNADRLDFDKLPDFLPLADANLLALKGRFLSFRCHSDITQQYFRTIVEEFMSFKRNFGYHDGCLIYYRGFIAPKQVFDGFLYTAIVHNRQKRISRYAVKRSANSKLVVTSVGYNHYIYST